MIERRSILVVEDNPDDLELAKLAFERAGIDAELLHAADGQQAIDRLFAAGAVMPDLILLDLKLPYFGGLEVLRRLRADPRTRRVVIVVFSSSIEESDRRSCYDLGANSFVRKPVDFDEFIETARLISRYWFGLNAGPP